MLGKDAFQEADIFGITMPVVKRDYLVRNTNDLPRIAREAYHIATTGRPGPVLIDIPKDIGQSPFTGDLDAQIDLPGYSIDEAYDIDEDDVKKMAAIINACGTSRDSGGSRRDDFPRRTRIDGVGDRLNAPVTSTLLGKGVFPETHALSLGMLGMHGTAYANKAMVECDLILNVGSRFDDADHRQGRPVREKRQDRSHRYRRLRVQQDDPGGREDLRRRQDRASCAQPAGEAVAHGILAGAPRRLQAEVPALLQEAGWSAHAAGH